MKKTRPLPQKPPVITSSLDINKIIEGFKPTADTMLRKCLVDGFEMVKKHAELEAFKADDVDFGGFKPAVPPSNATKMMWLDTLIHTQLGGKREGLKVVWTIREGKFEFDPWTGTLEKLQ